MMSLYKCWIFWWRSSQNIDLISSAAQIQQIHFLSLLSLLITNTHVSSYVWSMLPLADWNERMTIRRKNRIHSIMLTNMKSNNKQWKQKNVHETILEYMFSFRRQLQASEKHSRWFISQLNAFLYKYFAKCYFYDWTTSFLIYAAHIKAPQTPYRF